MAEVYKFFNSAPGDERWYYASDFADYFGSVLCSGLLHTDGNPGLRATVVAGTLTTKVSPGKAIMKGYPYENTSDLTLMHDIPETTLKRIDRIVLRLDLTNASRHIKLFVKKGVSASAPVAPDLQRDQYIYELSLAQVLVRENTTQLLETDLKDERYYEDLCGFVTSLITVPTERFQEEWDTWFKSVQEEGFAPYRDTGYKENLKTIDKTSIVAGVNELKEDYVRSPGYATATGTNTYAVTLNPAPTSYKEGMGIVVKITNASTGAATINVNGLGAKPILKANGLAVSDLKAGAVYTLRYSGSAFMLQGEGGNEQEALIYNASFMAKSFGTYSEHIRYSDDIYVYTSTDRNESGFYYIVNKYLKSKGTLISSTTFRNTDNPAFSNNVLAMVTYAQDCIFVGDSSKIYVYNASKTLIKSIPLSGTSSVVQYGRNTNEIAIMGTYGLSLYDISGTFLKEVCKENRTYTSLSDFTVNKLSNGKINVVVLKSVSTTDYLYSDLQGFNGYDYNGGISLHPKDALNAMLNNYAISL